MPTPAPSRRAASSAGFMMKNKQQRRSRRNNFFIRPRDSGGGGPLELAKRANRGGGGAGLDASLPPQGNQRRHRYRLKSPKSRRGPRPFHHPAAQGGPPSPLSRGRMI